MVKQLDNSGQKINNEPLTAPTSNWRGRGDKNFCILGNVIAYSSAIVKVDDKTLVYYAVYGKDEEIPELVFENQLVYKKIE